MSQTADGPQLHRCFQRALSSGLLLVFIGNEVVEPVSEVDTLIGHGAINCSLAGPILDPNAIFTINTCDGNGGEGLHNRKLDYAYLRGQRERLSARE